MVTINTEPMLWEWGECPGQVLKVTGEESQSLNLEAGHFFKQWVKEPVKETAKKLPEGRRSTSRGVFQKPSKKSVSRGMEWTTIWINAYKVISTVPGP